MGNIKPKDIIAVLLLITLAGLKYFGIDSTFDDVASLVVGYYFGHRKDGVDSGR